MGVLIFLHALLLELVLSDIQTSVVRYSLLLKQIVNEFTLCIFLLCHFISLLKEDSMRSLLAHFKVYKILLILGTMLYSSSHELIHFA